MTDTVKILLWEERLVARLCFHPLKRFRLSEFELFRALEATPVQWTMLVNFKSKCFSKAVILILLHVKMSFKDFLVQRF